MYRESLVVFCSALLAHTTYDFVFTDNELLYIAVRSCISSLISVLIYYGLIYIIKRLY